ncbi:MAG: hypothetical protein AAGH60_14415 [Pseudomonadota bacterium]
MNERDLMKEHAALPESGRVLMGRRAGGAIREIAHFDAENPASLTVEFQQDCTPVLEVAATIADEEPGKDLRHVGIIPDFVIEQAMSEGWWDDPAAIRRWLNDPDNKDFRTWKGQV